MFVSLKQIKPKPQQKVGASFDLTLTLKLIFYFSVLCWRLCTIGEKKEISGNVSKQLLNAQWRYNHRLAEIVAAATPTSRTTPHHHQPHLPTMWRHSRSQLQTWTCRGIHTPLLIQITPFQPLGGAFCS